MSVKVICKECNQEMDFVEPYYHECPKCKKIADPEMEWYFEDFEIQYSSIESDKGGSK